MIFTGPGTQVAPDKVLFLVPLLLASASTYVCCHGLWHQPAELLGYVPDISWRDLSPSLNVQGSREHPCRPLKGDLSTATKVCQFGHPKCFIWKLIIFHHKCFIIASWIIHLQLNNLKLYGIMVLWEKNITNLGPSCEEKMLTLPVYFHYAVEGFLGNYEI